MSISYQECCSLMLHRRWVAAIACLAAVSFVMIPSTSRAQSATGLVSLPSLAPVMDCSAVTSMDLSGSTDGTVTITSATIDTTTAATPFCSVKGTISPADIFVMRLPTQGWTQRYVQTGCGGECGMASISYAAAVGCVPVTDGTIASATTDMGHEGANDGSWAADNPQAQIDFAYRGMHVTSQVAKAILAKFYGQAPRYSYFDGCSDGGREGLMEAQRYPDDFDGILAGAPANDMIVQNSYHHGWNVLTNMDQNGNFILLADKLPMIHAAVVAACDRLDDVADGIINDPRRCRFDPEILLCQPGQDTSTCLTEAEAGVVRRLHDGATDPYGHRLEQRISHEWGSELDWTLFIPTAQGQVPGSENFVLAFLRYLGFRNVVDPNYQITDLQLNVPYFWKTVQTSDYLSATDPDLGAFEKRGGKLILWQGWADQHISPQGTLEYYHAVQDYLGDDTADRFLRLYLFPGVAHCGMELGPNQFDLLTPIMAWVETGAEPGKVIASVLDSNGNATQTRPVFPYPTVARYTGSGSTNDAANFVAYTPLREPRVSYEWVGKPLYTHGYQVWCSANGTQLVCPPSPLQQYLSMD